MTGLILIKLRRSIRYIIHVRLYSLFPLNRDYLIFCFIMFALIVSVANYWLNSMLSNILLSPFATIGDFALFLLQLVELVSIKFTHWPLYPNVCVQCHWTSTALSEVLQIAQIWYCVYYFNHTCSRQAKGHFVKQKYHDNINAFWSMCLIYSNMCVQLNMFHLVIKTNI